MNAPTETQVRDLCQDLTVALIETTERLLREGNDQQAVWESTRDVISQKFGFEQRAAANLTRLIFSVVARRLGCPDIYTPEQMETLRDLVRGSI